MKQLASQRTDLLDGCLGELGITGVSSPIVGTMNQPILLIPFVRCPVKVLGMYAAFMTFATGVCGLVLWCWWLAVGKLTHESRRGVTLPSQPKASSSFVVPTKRPDEASSVAAVANVSEQPAMWRPVVHTVINIPMFGKSFVVHSTQLFAVHRFGAIFYRAGWPVSQILIVRDAPTARCDRFVTIFDRAYTSGSHLLILLGSGLVRARSQRANARRARCYTTRLNARATCAAVMAPLS